MQNPTQNFNPYNCVSRTHQYLSNRANSCTSEEHGSHWSQLNAHLNSVLLSKASCFTFKNNFLKIFCFAFIFAQEKKLKKKKNQWLWDNTFCSRSNLNGYKEWRRNKQKDPCTLLLPCPHSALTLWSRHRVLHTASHVSSSGQPWGFSLHYSLSLEDSHLPHWIDPSLPFQSQHNISVREDFCQLV